jgi:hypothetical protein
LVAASRAQKVNGKDTLHKRELPAEIQALVAAAQEHKPEVPTGHQQITAEIASCPRCKQPRKKEDLVCSRCGMMFEETTRTRLLEREGDKAGRRGMMGGGAFPNEAPIIFEIDGVTLTLPVAEALVVGRSSDEGGNPDVSLNQFTADQRGVSRRHMIIRRKGPLTYIADLGSTNGTYLNGRRLQRGEERILRDGDEIHLSHLLIRVHFPEPTGG